MLFHQYASFTRNYNSIWDIESISGVRVHSTLVILREVVIYFWGMLSTCEGVNIEDQLWGIENYPTMFMDSTNVSPFFPITMDEILLVLKYFAKEKKSRSRRLDYGVVFIFLWVDETRSPGYG